MFALIALGLPAFAINPTTEVYIGQEPVRERSIHIGPQMRLRGGADWLAFKDGEGAEWQARFDERTGTPHVAWGPGIDLGSLETEADVETAVWAFVSRNRGLMGIEPDGLRLGRVLFDADRDAWFVRLDQVVDGENHAQHPLQTDGDTSSSFELPELEPASPQDLGDALEEMAQYGQPRVWRGGVEFTVQNDRLTMMRVATYPEANLVDVNPRISAAEAIRIAIENGPEPGASHTVDGAVSIVLPLEVPGALEYHLCWLVRSSTNLGTATPGIWASFIDAHSGELLNVHNQVRFDSGTVYGVHDTRTVNGDLSTSPMPFVSIESSEDSSETELDGSFDVDGSEFTSTLDGTFFQAENQAGQEGRLDFSDSEGVWTTDDATQAEISSYVFLHHVWEWGERYAPEVGITNSRIVTNLNIDSACNAYYDGDVNFYQAGSGCNNTGRIADVNYHEWGHGFHAYAADTWWVDGSIGEGASDVMSFFQTADEIVAPYFQTNGSGIRNVAEDRVYPDDWVDEVHYDGLIFAGAVWDLWAALEDDLGVDIAYDTIAELYVSALKTNPTTPDTYDAFLAADDDNGDLGDGTPNQCAIVEAFALHGLGPGGSDAIMELAHEGLTTQSVDVDEYVINGELLNLAPECTELEDADVQLYFSTNLGADYTSVSLDLDEAILTGAIPRQPAGTIVQYFIEAETSSGTDIYAPSGGAISPFTFAVGDLETIYCQDFEADDGNFSHYLVAGEDIEGADDWQWGAPGGMADDPNFAWSGNYIWGNDISPDEQWNGEYQNEKFNRLVSEAIEVGDYDFVVLDYRRWLNVEDGYYDQARILANDEVVWTNHESNRDIGDEHTQDTQWINHIIDISDVLVDGVVEISWELETDEGLSMGGWNIDDVCVMGMYIDDGDSVGSDTADTDSSPSDLGGEGIVGGDLSGCNCSTGTKRPEGILSLMGLLGLMGLVRRRNH